jgi:hypothetical protein
MLPRDAAGRGEIGDRDLVRREIELGQDLARRARPSRSLPHRRHRARRALRYRGRTVGGLLR